MLHSLSESTLSVAAIVLLNQFPLPEHSDYAALDLTVPGDARAQLNR